MYNINQIKKAFHDAERQAPALWIENGQYTIKLYSVHFIKTFFCLV